MKIQIALSNTDEKKDEKTEENKDEAKAPAPQGFGKNYAGWEEKMRATKNFGEIKRLDDNKLVAVDGAGNTIETFVIPTDRKNLKTDTMDSEQQGAPINKTGNDPKVDPKVEKGA